MFKLATPFFLICETPLHAGSGNDLGIVDLPIQRERHTDFPKVEGSSLKGCIREAFENPCQKPNQTKFIKIGNKTLMPDIKINGYQDAINLAFGPDNKGENGHAGALSLTDARLLLFPVKSMKGVFGWITCPKVLHRFKADMTLCGITLDFDIPLDMTASHSCELFIKDKIFFEEYTFSVKQDQSKEDSCSRTGQYLADHIFPKHSDAKADFDYWRTKLANDIVVLTDDDFRDFVNLSTEVITRTKIINETGTVQPGALFTEEYLPGESILYSLALTTAVFKETQKEKGIFNQQEDIVTKSEAELVMEFFKNGLPEIIQLGGNATIGKGLVRTEVLEVNNG